MNKAKFSMMFLAFILLLVNSNSQYLASEITDSGDNSESLSIGCLQTIEDGDMVFFVVRKFCESAIEADMWMLNTRSGKAERVYESFKMHSATASPDGEKAAYYVQREDGGGSIAVIDFREKSLSVLAHDDTSGTIPAWSPDGRWIALDSASAPAKDTVYGCQSATPMRWRKDVPHHLRIIDPGGIFPDQFSLSPLSEKGSWGWYPSGRKIIYSTGWNKDARIIMRDIGEKNEIIIIEGHIIAGITGVTFSPDGRSFFFAEFHDFPNQRPWIYSIDGGALIQPSIPEGSYTSPKWSPDGDRIAGIFHPSPSKKQGFEEAFFIWNRLSNETHIFKEFPGNDFDWLPNGELIFNEGKKLVVLRYDGENLKMVRKVYDLNRDFPGN